MRISDWSSDVCSSDLFGSARTPVATVAALRDLHPLAGRLRGRRGNGGQDRCRDQQPSEHLLHLAILQLMSRLLERSEEHTSELQSLMRISYAVFCLKKKNKQKNNKNEIIQCTKNNNNQTIETSITY